MHIYCRMIATVKLVSTSIPSHYHFCVGRENFLRSLVLKTLQYKVYSHNNFPVYSIVLLIIVTMLYIRSPEFIHLLAESLCPLTSISPFFPLSSPWKQTFYSLFLWIWLQKKVVFISSFSGILFLLFLAVLHWLGPPVQCWL